jgi:hypothetical protein
MNGMIIPLELLVLPAHLYGMVFNHMDNYFFFNITFYVDNYSSIVITTKPKAEFTFHVNSMSLFYILHKNCLKKLHEGISPQDTKLNGTSVASTSEVHTATMLIQK